MKKFVCILLLLSALVCCAENEYIQIEMNETLTEIEAIFGEGTPTEEGYYVFGDCLCAFYESGRLQSKTVYFEDIRQALIPGEYDFEFAEDLKQGASITVLTDKLGEGTEIMQINLSDEDNPGVRKVLAWRDMNGNVLEALLELDDGEWTLFAISENYAEEANELF